MESVKRYDCTNGKARHCYGCYEMTELPNGEYVSGDDFDRVSAENLALQQRLTVQDQRVDELETQVNSLEQRRQAEQQACRAAERRVEALCAFANEMVSAAFEGGSLDGADIQDIAVKHGLLRIETRKGECCEGCACREYGFPAECYRGTELIALKPTAEVKP